MLYQFKWLLTHLPLDKMAAISQMIYLDYMDLDVQCPQEGR